MEDDEEVVEEGGIGDPALASTVPADSILRYSKLKVESLKSQLKGMFWKCKNGHEFGHDIIRSPSCCEICESKIFKPVFP